MVQKADVEEAFSLPSMHYTPHFTAAECDYAFGYVDCYLSSTCKNARDGIFPIRLLDVEASDSH